jgi:hypothetical protein
VANLEKSQPTPIRRWEELYYLAVLETDWSKMPERIQSVEAAIADRLREFSLDHGGTQEENQAIVDALARLDVLRLDAARWRE